MCSFGLSAYCVFLREMQFLPLKLFKIQSVFSSFHVWLTLTHFDTGAHLLHLLDFYLLHLPVFSQDLLLMLISNRAQSQAT